MFLDYFSLFCISSLLLKLKLILMIYCSTDNFFGHIVFQGGLGGLFGPRYYGDPTDGHD